MIDVTIIIEAGYCNGLFDVKISDNNNNISFEPKLNPGLNEINLKLKLPNKLVFHLTGKNYKKDTIIDPVSKKIIQDRYIKIVDFKVDNKPFDENRIKQMFLLKSENNGIINSSYWGFNGFVEFDLPHDNSLDLHLSNLV